MSNVHPAVRARREFEWHANEVEQSCTALAHQLMSGELSEDEFDAAAYRILGADYHPAECVKEFTDRCDCPSCQGGVWPCVTGCGRLQTRGDGRRCPACARALMQDVEYRPFAGQKIGQTASLGTWS